jgi:glucose/mannose-6-phosphate isomerase
MRELIKNFPKQLDESIEISNGIIIEIDRDISNVIICGLGGSGIGGEIVKTWFKSTAVLPIEVCHSYDLPNYASSSSLIIACSYSGNTEETLSTLEQAIEAKAYIIGITSGGTLEKLITEINMPVVKVPGGLPPRSALAYPLVQLVKVLCSTVFPNNSLMAELVSAAGFLTSNQSHIITIAEDILKKVASKNMLFYSEDQLEPVGLRACQQINENSKELAFRNVIPEMNHNEIVGWAQHSENIYTVFLRSDLERSNNKKRLDITYEIIADRTDKLMAIDALGDNLVHQTLYLIHILDWVSLLRAEQKNIDIEEVKVIDYLKKQLAAG